MRKSGKRLPGSGPSVENEEQARELAGDSGSATIIGNRPTE
jgi:hypothetical protein